MKNGIFGQIKTEDIPETKALRRFTEQQLKNWIQTKLRQVKKAPASYVVKYKREGKKRAIDCYIQIKCGNQTWVGYNYEGKLQQALIHCLQQMIPNPLT